MTDESVLQLAIEAHRGLTTAVNTHRRLESCQFGQAQALRVLQLSLPQSDSLAKDVAEIQLQIANVDAKIGQAHRVLSTLLTPEPNRDGGPILKTVIESTTTLLAQHSKQATDAGQIAVPLVELLDMEDQVHELIADMVQRKMFPESEEEAAARNADWEEHNQRVLGYLNSLNLDRRSE
jgi:hypothetical protein